jgi:5-methylcytosine-specific restriction endonuclease McrA
MPKTKTFNRQSAYQWYLGSAFWRERRVAAFRRAKGVCERCKQRPATEVHHLRYIRIFNELPSDLQALCRQCHGDIHHRTPANDNQVSFNFDDDGGD